MLSATAAVHAISPTASHRYLRQAYTAASAGNAAWSEGKAANLLGLRRVYRGDTQQFGPHTFSTVSLRILWTVSSPPPAVAWNWYQGGAEGQKRQVTKASIAISRRAA